MRRHLTAAASGLAAASAVGLIYYGWTQSGYTPVERFDLLSIVLAVTFCVYFWRYTLKNWGRFDRGS